MYKGKKILAIIPARSGSKGLKDKNIKLLNGKPLIAYTIGAAINSNVFEDVIVSTDSVKYADISKEYGADVPFLRGESLASDIATTEAVVIDTIEKLKLINKEYDYFVILQPTSPLRDSNNIKEAIDLLLDNDLKSVVSVSKAEHSLTIYNTLKEDLSLEGFLKKSDNKRRQELDTYYRINGAIYIIETNEYLINKNFYGERSRAYIMDNKDSIDIDNDLDFKIAELLLKDNNKVRLNK
ncbi:cytidylyltransferase domain-containing protein [Clostridium gasigenes]|uniref:Acylneuraminate cytidylyltransferase family protein n=1 Tax=Clostridium gasigenes TaxID=94869 RepID=A0A7X0VR43_9CLOT|nr:acylneuraminate cytidylyltransferase family protein [Clostridium gasigenes]MBB6714603.1 acylneuraminate cytidylyltransferase family protein [Clostridium gasigenes]